MLVMDVRVYGVDLVSVIFRSAFNPRHTGPTSGFMVCGAVSYNSRSHLVFLPGKVNSFRYITQAWMKIIGYETAISDNCPWQQQTKLIALCVTII